MATVIPVTALITVTADHAISTESMSELRALAPELCQRVVTVIIHVRITNTTVHATYTRTMWVVRATAAVLNRQTITVITISARVTHIWGPVIGSRSS